MTPILSAITSYFTRTLAHVSARIVVSAGTEPGKWVSSRRFRDYFSLSVNDPSAFVSKQNGCGLTERNIRSLESSAALSIFLQSLNCFLYI